MPAGSDPSTNMNLLQNNAINAAPLGWKLYRFGLVIGGFIWVCITTTLCGCSGANGWVMNQSGRGYYNRGNYAAARSEFERALLDDPYNATYAYNVAKAMEKEGDITGAEKMYQHALTLDPAHQPAYHGATQMLASQGRQEEASELLAAWTQTQPYNAASHVEMAKLHSEGGNYAAAEQELNAALQIRPGYRQALNERKKLYQLTGRQIQGGAYSELAFTQEPIMQASYQQPMSYMPATAQTSGALHMAESMPQMDPTMRGRVSQASFMQNGMYGSPTMTTTTGAQFHQTQMVSGQYEMTAQGQMPQGAPIQYQAMPGMNPQSVPVPTPYGIPGQYPMGQEPQPLQLNGQQPQPIQMGAPIPVTQMPQGAVDMNIQNVSNSEIVMDAPSEAGAVEVQAF
ncbi:tetratricopeptide repeat protein [Planctomicrobium sp. SH668]|uniref:tetratricopeptide repeat protein n=1 Tax=Planctomicrobium sp. SH668 TaxID=3448126 RepID=UPI003F5BACB8